MVRVVLDETGIVVRMGVTPEYIAEIESWRDTQCSAHQNREWRRRPTSNGGVQIRAQCLDCGHVIGGSRKQTPDDVDLPMVDEEIARRYDAKRAGEHHVIMQKHARMQYEKENSFFQEHSRYLGSDAWKAKRRLVLKRASGICEGCGTNPATEVHHLSYAHHMDEFLFELVAVCRECHDRLHADEIDPDESGG